MIFYTIAYDSELQKFNYTRYDSVVHHSSVVVMDSCGFASINTDGLFTLDLTVAYQVFYDADVMINTLSPFNVSSVPADFNNLVNNAYVKTEIFYQYCEYAYEIPLPVCPPPVVTANASLDGDGCKYKDGQSVSVSSRTGVFSVDWSRMAMVQDSQLTPLYSVSSVDGHKLLCPEAFLTAVV